MISDNFLMKRLMQILCIIFISIILYGCENSKTVPVLTSKDFHKGTSALEMEFIKGIMPDAVYENSMFLIGINIKNNGAENIKKGLLNLGIERDYINLKKEELKTNLGDGIEIVNENTLRFNLSGKNIYNPLGQQGFIYLSAETNELAKQSQTLISNIALTACYDYKTVSVSTICIDTDITNTDIRDKNCIVKELSLDSQGAPVAVTKIEYQMLPSGPNYVKPEFFITIENKGSGEVVSPEENIIKSLCGLGSLPKPESDIGFDEKKRQLVFNVVELSASLSIGFDELLRCEPYEDDYYRGVIKLKDGIGIAKCTLEGGIDVSKGSYTTPLRIQLDYGYTFS